MTPLQPYARPMIDASIVRHMIAATLTGILVFVSTAFAGAGATAPMAETGGIGSGFVDIADMLRGDYSPVAATEEIAVTEVEESATVSEMLRGGNSPVDSTLETAITEVSGSVTAAEMLRGDQSPIEGGVV